MTRAFVLSQQSGSSKSTRPSPSSSMQLPQISVLQTGLSAQSESAQSTRPSPSLSTPSVQFSVPQWSMALLPQVPPLQVSVVQVLPSLQSDAVSHGLQPGIVETWH